MISNTARFGADYYLGKKTIFGVLFNGNLLDQERDGRTTSTVARADNSLDYSTLTHLVAHSDRFNAFANVNVREWRI